MSASSFEQLYRERLKSAEDAAAMIPAGAKVCMGLGAAQPPAILEAMAQRGRAGQLDGTHVYYMLATAVAGNTILSEDLTDRIIPVSIFHGGIERALDKGRKAKGLPPIDFLPTHFSHVPRVMCDHVGVDTLVTTVSPMDANGNFSLGTCVDYALAVSQKPGTRLLLEVNPNMPYVHGNCMVHVSQVAALVENDTPIPVLPQATRTPVDDAIGAIIAGLVRDGDCLQMGIGALPDAVCAALADHRHLGIHTEMMTSGLAQLMKSGVVDNSRKQIHTGRTVYAFAMGDQALYDYLNDNPLFDGQPVDYVNNPAVICQNDNVISVNATLQIDLNGACNSEYMNGQFSASGGQVDFVRGAYMSKGGRSIIACHSTAAKGKVSRITPRLDGPVTTPRNDTAMVVTEHGYVDLKGRTLVERAKLLISIAHPDFREELEQQAFEMGLTNRLHPVG